MLPEKVLGCLIKRGAPSSDDVSILFQQSEHRRKLVDWAMQTALGGYGRITKKASDPGYSEDLAEIFAYFLIAPSPLATKFIEGDLDIDGQLEVWNRIVEEIEADHDSSCSFRQANRLHTELLLEDYNVVEILRSKKQQENSRPATSGKTPAKQVKRSSSANWKRPVTSKSDQGNDSTFFNPPFSSSLLHVRSRAKTQEVPGSMWELSGRRPQTAASDGKPGSSSSGGEKELSKSSSSSASSLPRLPLSSASAEPSEASLELKETGELVNRAKEVFETKIQPLTKNASAKPEGTSELGESIRHLNQCLQAAIQISESEREIKELLKHSWV